MISTVSAGLMGYYEIFTFSRGYPRLINVICDRALLTGYVSDIKKIVNWYNQLVENNLLDPEANTESENSEE